MNKINNIFFLKSYIFYFLILLLNFPKINLIEIAGAKQGIRLDDILILLFVAFNLNHISLDKTKLIIILYVTFTYLFSFHSNFEILNVSEKRSSSESLH